jgi:heptosyltransferase-2
LTTDHTSNVLNEPRPAHKILVMELAGLGDDVHLLPALWSLRRKLPEAELHVMVSAHVGDLFKLTPWVNRVWLYPRVPRRPGFLANIGWARRLRAEKFDLVINTTGSDRSALLTSATGATQRFGRRPPGGGRFWWPWMFTRVLEYPFWQEPMYRQKLAVLAQAGLADRSEQPPHFEVAIGSGWRRELGIPADDDRSYIHLSPCAGNPQKELPLPQLAELYAGLRETFPQLRIVLSCADLPRERQRLEALLPLLPERPWKIFSGTLDIPKLAALIQGAALHVCGDSGSLHVAFMTGTPAVAWFREHVNQKEWIPRGARYRVLVAPDVEPCDALHGIDNGALISAARELLSIGAGR